MSRRTDGRCRPKYEEESIDRSQDSMCDGFLKGVSNFEGRFEASKGVSNFEGRFEASKGVSSASKLYREVLEVVELLT